jgi:YVTN family beta-propeller protein
VRASDGKLLETWTGATSAFDLVPAMGRIIVSGGPGLFSIDPSQPAGAVTTVASNLPVNADGIVFDGSRFWTANFGPPSSISIITPGPTIPWTVTTVTTGFAGPFGAVFDGSNVWVTQNLSPTILRLDSSGGILQTVTVGDTPVFPAFDGANIWVPNTNSNSVSVIRASSGAVLQTITGIVGPISAAFDGQRVLIATFDQFYLFKAADFSSLGSAPAPASSSPYGVCSDGINFWIALQTSAQVARF